MATTPKGLSLLEAEAAWAMETAFTATETRDAYMQLLRMLTSPGRQALPALKFDADRLRKLSLSVPELPRAIRTASLALDVSAAVFSHVVVTSEFIYPAMLDWMVAQDALLITMRGILGNLDQASPALLGQVVMDFLTVVRGFEEATLVYSVVARMLAGNVTPPVGLEGPITKTPLDVDTMTAELFAYCTTEGTVAKFDQVAVMLRDKFKFGVPLDAPTALKGQVTDRTSNSRLRSAAKALGNGIVGFTKAMFECTLSNKPDEAVSTACRWLRDGKRTSDMMDVRRQMEMQLLAEKAAEQAKQVASTAGTTAVTVGLMGVQSGILPVQIAGGVLATAGAVAGPVTGLIADTAAANAGDTKAPGWWQALKDKFVTLRATTAIAGCAATSDCEQHRQQAENLAALKILLPVSMTMARSLRSWTMLPIVSYLSCFVPYMHASNEEMGELLGIQRNPMPDIKLPTKEEVVQGAIDSYDRPMGGDIPFTASTLTTLADLATESGSDSAITRLSINPWTGLLYASRKRCEMLKGGIQWVTKEYGSVLYQTLAEAALWLANKIRPVLQPAWDWLPEEAREYLLIPHKWVERLLTGLGIGTGVAAYGLSILLYGVIAFLVYVLLLSLHAKLSALFRPMLVRLFPSLRKMEDGYPIWREPGYMERITGEMQAQVRKDATALRGAVDNDVPLELTDVKLLLGAVENAIATATAKKEPDLTELQALRDVLLKAGPPQQAQVALPPVR
jgi:hypothetical protein